MKIVSITLTAIMVLGIFSSCNKRLDSFLFNNSTIDAYLLDDYQGEKTFELDENYHISSDHIYEFTYTIQDEEEALQIHAIYVGDLTTIHQDTVILYCHGNKDHMDFYWNRQKLLAHVGSKHRFGVLQLDYPGFGMSEGSPTEENMYASVEGSLKWLQDQGVSDERLIIYGFSLGSAPATYISANPELFSLKPRVLILENPFASSEVMAQSSSALSFPGIYFTDIKIANADEIQKVNQPFLWFHGTDDTFLTIEKHGQVVFDRYEGENGQSIIIEGATHDGESGVPKKMGLENYLNTLRDFITE